MSKEKLFEIIDATLSELKKLKTGILVRATLPQIIELDLISDSEIKKLQSPEYSKMVFDMNFPILKEVDVRLPILENRMESGYTRYYAHPINSGNSKYLISSEWYDRNQEDYIRWLKRKVNKP